VYKRNNGDDLGRRVDSTRLPQEHIEFFSLYKEENFLKPFPFSLAPLLQVLYSLLCPTLPIYSHIELIQWSLYSIYNTYQVGVLTLKAYYAKSKQEVD
jgi:hypothetical protein